MFKNIPETKTAPLKFQLIKACIMLMLAYACVAFGTRILAVQNFLSSMGFIGVLFAAIPVLFVIGIASAYLTRRLAHLDNIKVAAIIIAAFSLILALDAWTL
jgi:hypothetical protein